jgi:hypothetical protein
MAIEIRSLVTFKVPRTHGLKRGYVQKYYPDRNWLRVILPNMMVYAIPETWVVKVEAPRLRVVK